MTCLHDAAVTSQPTAPERQRGVSMLFALMTLVALSLAAVALVRSVDTSTLILGNLSFKEDSLLASDETTRLATTLVASNSVPVEGYYKTMPANLDVTGSSSRTDRTVVDWKRNNCADYASGSFAKCIQPVDQRIELPNGVWARYIVTKMCTDVAAGNPDCVGPVNMSTGESVERGELQYKESERPKSSNSNEYYRIIVRTEGTRDTVSYTETIAHTY